ncbi:hypothetical protein RAC83_000846 [Xylella fastidiosa]|nr:hypothetical protein [Xylella fastidiosa]
MISIVTHLDLNNLLIKISGNSTRNPLKIELHLNSIFSSSHKIPNTLEYKLDKFDDETEDIPDNAKNHK